ETTYTIRVTAGEQTKDLTLTIKELTELLVAPNPYKYGSPGHDEIKFMYKVAQAGAAEVLLLIADPYGNIVYKATYTSGEVVSPGQQEISWDGTNSKGNRIASGMYQAVVKITLTNLSTEVLKKNFMVIW
ncbi:MAG: FlgD immunoglobulin-like domain containing protein, partial [candidate division WOR-3 bacterium]|nr:FlgD immunoglobulin-like domain containing protein [candidate division WOR-3 bacterium]